MVSKALWTRIPSVARRLDAAAVRTQLKADRRRWRRSHAKWLRRLGAPKRPQKRVRARSAANVRRGVLYNAMLERFWAKPENWHCKKCGDTATDAHHVKPRSVRPDLVCDESNIIGLCRLCHQFVKDYPAAAYAVGLLKHANDP